MIYVVEPTQQSQSTHTAVLPPFVTSLQPPIYVSPRPRRESYSRNSFADERRRFSDQISITSLTGVGSSTLFKELKRRFPESSYGYLSAGEVFRSRAVACGFGKNIEAFAEYVKNYQHLGHDEWCDDQMQDFGHKNKCFGEGRLVHVYMRYAFKVLLTCHIEIRAGRRHADNLHMTLAEVREKMAGRDRDDEARYRKQYPDSMWPMLDFDFVVDTGLYSPPQILDKIIIAHDLWKEKMPGDFQLITGPTL